MVRGRAKTGICMAVAVIIGSLMAVSCGQGGSAGPTVGQGASPGVPGFGALASVPRPGFLEKSAAFTSNLFLGFGARITPGAEPNTRIVYRHIRVWYLPCEPLPMSPVAPIIMRDLYSGSEVYLDREGLVRPRPKPDYRTKMGRARLEAVLGNKSLMEDVLTFPECPERVERVSKPRLCPGLSGWPDYDTEDIGEPPIPKVGIAVNKRGCMGLGWTVSYCWPTGPGRHTCEEGKNRDALAAAEAKGMAMGHRNVYLPVLGDESGQGRVTSIQAFPILEETPELELGEEAYTLHPHGGERMSQFIPPGDVPEGLYLLVTRYEASVGEVEHGFKVRFWERD